MDPNKIFVSGHPYYNELTKKELRFGFDDILILSKSASRGTKNAYDQRDIISEYDKLYMLMPDI